MTQVKLYKLKFKPDAKEIWLDWSRELLRRKNEVVATLKNEGVVSESCFVSGDGESVYYFMVFRFQQRLNQIINIILKLELSQKTKMA